jgi:[protein-PII] uridylyltransferase
MAVDIRRLESAWQLTLVAIDRPGLFASVAGTLASFGMNILKAEAFANRQGLVLDTFTFADPSRTLDLNPSEVDRLQTVLDVLTGRCMRPTAEEPAQAVDAQQEGADSGEGEFR